MGIIRADLNRALRATLDPFVEIAEPHSVSPRHSATTQEAARQLLIAEMLARVVTKRTLRELRLHTMDIAGAGYKGQCVLKGGLPEVGVEVTTSDLYEHENEKQRRKEKLQVQGACGRPGLQSYNTRANIKHIPFFVVTLTHALAHKSINPINDSLINLHPNPRVFFRPRVACNYGCCWAPTSGGWMPETSGASRCLNR